MSKILTIADIHIHDYPTRNPSNRFRLYQGSRIVAQNIIKVGKQEGCDYIVLAGDIFEKSNSRPYVLNEVKYFLDTIMSNFREGIILLGNHDADSKASDNQELSDSALGVMLPSNLHYAHGKVLQIDNTLCGFCNWMPEFNLDFIESKVDVLFTHATICYDDSGVYESQYLDESKFDLAICGDIHRMASRGGVNSDDPSKIKYVSIGIPQRCKMGDSDLSSGVVFDCITKEWKWVNLNPDDNLLKFEYTDSLDYEGYHPESNTWFVYKDPTILNSVNSGAGPKIDAWTEIEGLIQKAIIQYNLQDVHQEVIRNIKDPDELDVDFAFHLKYLRCHNWRSIEDATIDFHGGNNTKIFLSGPNGSGKSSILSAIRYAFLDCNTATDTGVLSLKSFIQFGKKDCFTEIEFEYKGSTYIIHRGTKDYFLSVNGELQKYNNKKQFEQDVRDRFKFLEYMDEVLMFNSERGRFVSGVSSERLTEIVAKFLHLGKLDLLHDTATVMYDNMKKDRQQWNNKAQEVEKVLKYIQEKLNLITLPSLTLQQLEDAKQEGLEIQRKNNLWNQYITKSANLQARIDTYTSDLGNIVEKSKTLRDPEQIDSEIAWYNQEIQNLNAKLVDLGNIRVNLEYKTRELDKLKSEGNQAWIEAQKIGLNKRCSMCGQEIKTAESLLAHKQELLSKVDAIRPQVLALQQEIQELTYLKDNSDQEYSRLNQDIRTYNSEISKRMSEKNEISEVYRRIEETKNLLERAKSELSALGVVEKVELPENFMNTMSSIEVGITTWTAWESHKSDEALKLTELENLKKEISRLDACLEQLEAYCKITGPIGLIYEEIMNRLAKIYSDNIAEYQVIRSGKNSRERLSLTPMFKKGSETIPYGLASSGEKTILDLHMLEKLIPNSGLLILDEFLRNLDSNKLDVVVELLTSMKIGTLILTSHAVDIGNFYNHTICLSLSEDGKTQIKCN